MTEILIDSANISKIRELENYYDIKGITTNPTILAKECEDLSSLFLEIKNFITNKYEIHIQTTEKESKKILEEARKLKSYFGEKFYIKIPITKEGLKAVKECKKENINVTVTAVLSSLQVLAACKAGADYVAPYVNRMENIGYNSIALISEMLNISSDYNTKILVASFKNEKQVKDMVLLTCDAITLSTDLLEKSIWHPYTDKSIEDFNKDWQKKFKDKKVVDFL